MSSEQFTAVASAGTLRSDDGTVTFDHTWTDAGVDVEVTFTGAHLLHLAIAGCVLNDTYREAVSMGIKVDGVRVTASGDFDRTTWQSTGIAYSVDIDSPAPASEISRLLATVDDVAEIPKSLRAGCDVRRV